LAFWYSRRWSGGWEERPPDPEIKVGHGFSLAAELPLGVARLRDDTDLKSAGGKTTGADLRSKKKKTARRLSLGLT